MKDGGEKALRERQLADLVYAIQHYRKVADTEYPQAVRELNRAIDPRPKPFELQKRMVFPVDPSLRLCFVAEFYNRFRLGWTDGFLFR